MTHMVDRMNIRMNLPVGQYCRSKNAKRRLSISAWSSVRWRGWRIRTRLFFGQWLFENERSLSDGF